MVSGPAAVVLATAAPSYENPAIATSVTGAALAPSLTVRVAAVVRLRAPAKAIILIAGGAGTRPRPPGPPSVRAGGSLPSIQTARPSRGAPADVARSAVPPNKKAMDISEGSGARPAPGLPPARGLAERGVIPPRKTRTAAGERAAGPAKGRGKGVEPTPEPSDEGAGKAVSPPPSAGAVPVHRSRGA